MSYRIIPIVKPKNNLKKLERVIKAMPVNFDWLNSRYSSVFDELVKDLNEIIKMTLQAINDYEDFAEMRAEIEILFKSTKALFGLKICTSITEIWRFQGSPSVCWISFHAVLHGKWT